VHHLTVVKYLISIPLSLLIQVSLPYKYIGNNITINPWIRVLLDKLLITQIVKKFPAFYWTRIFITVFPKTLHWSLSWARWSQSRYFQPVSLKSFLLLVSNLRVNLTSVLFPSGFPTRILYIFLISPMRATWSVHLIVLDFITLIIFYGEAPHYALLYNLKRLFVLLINSEITSFTVVLLSLFIQLLKLLTSSCYIFSCVLAFGPQLLACKESDCSLLQVSARDHPVQG